MSCNQLTTVPKSITKPSNLTRLDLRYNQLTTVPDTITKLSKLTELILSYNPLKTIPKSITSLSNLNRVQIENWSFETKESGARSQELGVSGSKY